MDSSKKGKRKRGRRGRMNQNFSSYISFGLYSTMCSGCFCLVYFLLLVGLMPLLQSDDASSNVVPTENGHLRALKVNDYEKKVIKNMSHNLKERFDNFKHFHGITDKNLKDSVMEQFNKYRSHKNQKGQSEQAQQQARELSDDFLNDQDAWGAACSAALETTAQFRDFECKPVLVKSSTMGAVAPLINYDNELDNLDNIFPSDSSVIRSREKHISSIIEEHLFSTTPMLLPQNLDTLTEERVVQLEYDVWVGIDALINLLHQFS